MTVTIHEYRDGEYHPIGRVESGEVIEDTDGRVARIVERMGTDEDELVRRVDGPMLLAAKE